MRARRGQGRRRTWPGRAPASRSGRRRARRRRRPAARAPASTSDAFRAAGAGSPRLATFTNGRSAIQPRSSGLRRSPRTATTQASSASSGRPSPRAKSFAVPAGTTPSGTPARPAAAATGATLPSPPATTTRSAPDAAARSAWSSSKRCTSAPAARRYASTSSGSQDPEPGFATNAIEMPGMLPPMNARQLDIAIGG